MNDKVIRGFWASAYCNESFICVYTRSGYRGGTEADRIKGKQYLLPHDADDDALGTAVWNTLSHSRCVLPEFYPDVSPEVECDAELYDNSQRAERYEEWVRHLMGIYGYKTKRALFKNMKSCSIEKKLGILTISPSIHEKLEAWSGFAKDDGVENVVIPDNSTTAEIGAALRLAFEKSIA